ncbi:MAG: hypothetical protein JG782_1498 [Anaerophaga sp.]|nr:hypothetical protein [Anaerophaga sp.]MDK2841467.1 hypothetical protein [Anaerophaga sp.]
MAKETLGKYIRRLSVEGNLLLRKVSNLLGVEISTHLRLNMRKYQCQLTI